MANQNIWDQRFLDLASHIAAWSKDPSTKVGAVIVDNQRRIISTGYNGFAKGVQDHEHLLNNREEKYARVVHAEINAIIFAKQSLQGCTLYTSPMPPCSNCAAIIINSGIKRVVTYPPHERWRASCEKAHDMFTQAGVSVFYYDKTLPEKEYRISEDAYRVNVLLGAAVVRRDLTSPPEDYVRFDPFIVASPATGVWKGKENQIAFHDGQWYFVTPSVGMKIRILNENYVATYVNGKWE